MRLFYIIIALHLICITSASATVRKRIRKPSVPEFELGWVMGRIEGVGGVPKYYDGGFWQEGVFAWKPKFLKPMSLQMRIGFSILDTLKNTVRYHTDSTALDLKEEIRTSILVMTLGADYSIKMLSRPRTALRLGLGVSRIYLKYSSLIEEPKDDSLGRYSSGRKSRDLGKSFTYPYLRAGLDFSLGNTVGIIVESTYFRLPKAYQRGGFALGQFGPKHSINYFVVGTHLVFRL